MSKDRTRQLSTVGQVAEVERERAAGRLQAQRDQHNAAETQLKQLRDFQQEYEQRLRDASAAGMSALQLRDYRRFLASLAEAIEQQEGVVERCDDQLGRQRQELQQQSQRCSHINELVARYRQQEQRTQLKREQRVEDERHASRRNGS